MHTDKKKLSLLDRLSMIISTLFGVGYTPLCPGSASCVVASILFILIKNKFYFSLLTAISIILAFLFCTRAERVCGEKDCKRIVIDDFSGMLLTYLFVPATIKFLLIGFFLFRMLDMLKIPPADKIENCQGALGIVGDDLVAGLYSCGLLYITRIIAN